MRHQNIRHPAEADPGAPVERWSIEVNGVVQGVGYRPFVYRTATAMGLTGWVLNDTLGVRIEVNGFVPVLKKFLAALTEQAPLLARVDRISLETAVPVDTATAPTGFEIRKSVRTVRARTFVAPDSHVCGDCLQEVLDPADRRYRYPFTNCTHCGPRYSLIQKLPYDRAQTTMARFAMCPDCAKEYTDPGDRRYHAQPNACPACGPRLTLAGPTGDFAEGEDALRLASDALANGRIVAVKSVGGFHLAVNARDRDAVLRLRRAKRRDSKPFALLAADLAGVSGFAEWGPAEAELLIAPARPIVLLRKIPGAIPEEVAPRNPSLGVMLPSTPLHHLLLLPPGPDLLVMTSGNASGHPIEYRNHEALARLFSVADLVLHHDRDIQIRVDDSVVRCSVHPELDEPLVSFLRRSRGYAPYPVRVDDSQEPVVALGAELKTTVAVADGKSVFISQHIGDLKNDATFSSHQTTASHVAALHELQPRYIACDSHPSFRATRTAVEQDVAEVLPVQHHHAHMAACMAENRLSGTTLGVVFDGAGYGGDGTIWGGEFLLGDFERVDRVSRLRYLPLLGGDKAVREPVRTGFALALDAFRTSEAACAAFPALRDLSQRERHVFTTMIRKGVNAPPTSSMGRLFDGVAALLGLCTRAEYEAQGPIELEGLLDRDLALTESYSFDHVPRADGVEVDPRPVVRQIAVDLAAGETLSVISRRFHSGVVGLVVDRCLALRAARGIRQVVLSGGVFLNEFLAVNCLVKLRRAGFHAYGHRLVPCNDGGISLGQVMVAGALIRARQENQ
ncbi:carbamoyltransferase HypF [Nocardiopsis ansamitocini]|uniref:Carbamoyltransferase n=1 Tax=Nocardiopsis ansamitocini TaxID=1670832 RepID=A0A9W6PAU1_9ACTN|nr:carbamoyltransferase HypF [Nocardiopsis ansamitocini]GLU50158.1 carbamoyltransferase HypF [Nocardiopsis ansamitocini]